MKQWSSSIYDWLYGLYTMGGEILVVLILTALIMWSLIIERYLYFAFSCKHAQTRYLQLWQTTDCTTIAELRLLKNYYLSEYRLQSERGIGWIRQFTKLSLLLGLLGTILGLISVFESQQLFDASPTTLYISGDIARTIIPTTAGLSVSLSGLFFLSHLHNLANKATYRLAGLLH